MVSQSCNVAGSLSSTTEWFDAFRGFWQPKLDALGTELARERLAQRKAGSPRSSVAAHNDDDETISNKP